MPISYEPAQPFSPGISYSYGQTVQNNEDAPRLMQARQLAAAASGGGYGGGGRGGNVPYDTGIQDAINHRDDSKLKADMFNSSQATKVQGDMFDQQSQIAGMQTKAQLEAQLSEVQLSQQEKMRMQRMKNAVGEVSANPDYSDEEKRDMIMQLKTGIDPFENRLKKERLAQETIQKNSMAESQLSKAAINQKILEGMGKSAQDRTSFVHDPVALSEIAADLKANMPEFIPGPNGIRVPITPQMIEEMAKQEAMKQGLGSHMYVNPDGTLHPISGTGTGDKAAGGTGAGKKGKDDGADHPLGITAQEYMKQRNGIVATLNKQAGMQVDDPSTGGKKPLHPELHTAEGMKKAVGQEMADAGLPPTLKDYNDGKTPKADPAAAGSRSGYKSLFGKKEVAAAATGKPDQDPSDGLSFKPFDHKDPTTANPVQQTFLARIDARVSALRGNPALDDNEKASGSRALESIKQMLAENGSVDKIKAERPDVYERLKALGDYVDELEKKKKEKAPVVGDRVGRPPRSHPVPNPGPTPAQKIFNPDTAAFIDRLVK